MNNIIKLLRKKDHKKINEKKVIKKFEAGYTDTVSELLVLVRAEMGGARSFDGMLNPSVEFIASVDLATGEFSRERGRLEWIRPRTSGWGFHLKGLTIYHVKVRKCIQQELEPHINPVMNNRYLLMEIIKTDAKHPQLDEIRNQKIKPVSMEDGQVGTFILNREFSWFEGAVDWLGETCPVKLNTDEEDGDTAEQALQVFKRLYPNRREWDRKARRFAAEKMTVSANEWQGISLEDGEEQPGAITEEQFAKRMRISEMFVSAEGDFTLYYYDDDMFYGHIIVVEVCGDGEFGDAYIEG